MNFFTEKASQPSINKIKMIQAWMRDLLQLDHYVPISVSQLKCHEPDCPPIETVIAVMTQPIQTFKIHRSIDELDYEQVLGLLGYLSVVDA